MLASITSLQIHAAEAFQEGKALQSAGRAEVLLPDNDSAMFEILLSIVHSLPSTVPAELSLARLAGVASL